MSLMSLRQEGMKKKRRLKEFLGLPRQGCMTWDGQQLLFSAILPALRNETNANRRYLKRSSCIKWGKSRSDSWLVSLACLRNGAVA